MRVLNWCKGYKTVSKKSKTFLLFSQNKIKMQNLQENRAKNSLNIVNYVWKSKEKLSLLVTDRLQGTQLSGWWNLAQLKESDLSFLEVMEGIYTFPCLKQKRLDSSPGTPNVMSPAPCLHGSAQTQHWPAEAAGGVTTLPPGRGHHTRPSVLSWNLICLAEAEHRQKRLEFHPCSPAAQRRLCVEQKWIPLVRQSLTRTGNTYLKKNLKVNYPILQE